MIVRTIRAKRRAVSPVIGTILMVAITIVLAALLYVLVSSLLQPPEGQSIHLVLTASPNTTNATNSSWTDTYFTVQSKSGPADIYWNSSSLHVLVFSPDGILLTGHNITFDDLNPDGKADAGDKIHLRGMTSAYHGGKMRLMWDNAVVAEITIA